MTLADIASRLAGDLAELRREQAMLASELERARAAVMAREEQIRNLIEQLEGAGQALESMARRAVMAEFGQAGAEASLGVARAEAAKVRAERDTVRRTAWELTLQLGALEAALATGWLRRVRNCRWPGRPEAPIVLTVALGLARAELPPVIQMVRTEAARTPLLLVVDHDLDQRLDPAPAGWLRLPARRELPRRLAADSADYLRPRLGLLIQTLRPDASSARAHRGGAAGSGSAR